FLFFHHPAAQSTSGQTPAQVATNFAQAYTALAHTLSAADLAKTKQFLCSEDQTRLQSLYDLQKRSGHGDNTLSLKVSNVTTNGTQGTFQLTVVDGGQTTHRSGNLVNNSSRWLVCNTLSGSTANGSGSTSPSGN